MEIRTKAYGLLDINPDEIITFDNGLIGLEDLRQFVLIGDASKDVLLWLQSLEEEYLAFVVIQPRMFRPDYQPQIHLNELAGLELDSDDDLKDLLIYSIVVVPEDIKKMTANLQAPVLINTKKKKGKQIILNDDTYKIKESIFADN